MIVLLFALLILPCSIATTESDEKTLKDHLLSSDRYNHLLRPTTEQVHVKFHMTLSQLIGLNEMEQYMTTKVWLAQTWEDRRLTWNPSNFSDIKKIQLQSTKIWLPDVVLYNNNDGQYEPSLSSNAIITHEGNVSWTPPAIYKSTCNIRVKSFPFDSQDCKMIFRSWTYTRSDLNLTLVQDTADTTNMVPNGGWQLKSALAHLSESIRNDDYQEIVYNIIIKRKPLFYEVNLITPCISITCLAVLVFYTPSDFGEKMTLCISVLLALTVFLLLLSKMVPATSLETPLIGVFIVFAIILVTLSVIMSVVVLNFHHRTFYTHIMQSWERRIFLEFLPRWMMKRPQSDVSYDDSMGLSGMIKLVEISGQECIARTNGSEPITDSPEMKEIALWSSYIAESRKISDSIRKVSEDWKFVAMTVDRILFVVFGLALFIGSMYIFFVY